MRGTVGRNLRAFSATLLLGLAVFVASRLGTAQANIAAKPRYRAEVVASTVASENRAATLEALLNKRAAEGYKIFDIDRDATGNTLVVFELASQK